MYRSNQTPQRKIYKINNQITVPQIRVIGEDGKQVGVLSRDEGIDYALGQGLDLVLITESATPPIAKAIDYKKFLYQEEKKDKESKKSQKNTGVKEIRVGSPFAGEADVAARIKHTRKFLTDGYSVKVVIKFAGRSITHPEFGYKIIDKFKTDLAIVGKIEREPRFEGKQLIVTFSPSK